MKMNYVFFDQVRKFGEIDFPVGGSILHIWNFGEKHPLCGKRLIRRGGLTLLDKQYCGACVKRALVAIDTAAETG